MLKNNLNRKPNLNNLRVAKVVSEKKEVVIRLSPI